MFRILIPVDESEERAIAACEYAASFPEATDAVEITLLNVQEEFEVPGEYGKIESKDLYNEENFPESAKQSYDYLEDRGVARSLRREHGKPTERIIGVAEEIDADTIVMGGRKHSTVGKLVFGSVAQKVVLKCDRPVTIVSSK